MNITSRRTEGKRQYLVLVDAIKGICILMVILTHVEGRTDTIKNLLLYPFTVLPAVTTFLMLSSYVFSMAEDRWSAGNGKTWSISDWFRKDRFYPRYRRFFVPYAVIMFAELLFIKFGIQIKQITWETVWILFISGGRGPGAYYIIVLFEFLMVFPFLRYWFKKDPFTSVGGMILIHIVFDTMARYVWEMSDFVYDRMIFRFFTHIALGMILCEYQEVLSKTAVPVLSLAVGIIFKVNVDYLYYKPVLHIARWYSSAAIPSLYSFGLLALILSLEGRAKKHAKAFAPLCFLGKASFHILLTQKVYFYCARSFEFEQKLGGFLTIVLVDVVISVTIGCLFYCAHQAIEKRIKPRKRTEQTTQQKLKKQLISSESGPEQRDC